MAANESDYTLIKADRLIDGAGEAPIAGAALLMRGSTIEAIGRQADVRAPDGASVTEVDYGDATIVPGLVDCHTHLCAPGDGTAGDEIARERHQILLLQAAKNARTILHSGVTTIRENGAMGQVTINLKEGIRRGLAVGPKMVICARPITITGGHMGYWGSEVDGPWEARAEVRKLLKEGADYIKITATGGSTRTSDPNRASFTVEELRNITEEAHNAGVLTAAHCTSAQGVQNCLDAEVDMIIHCVFNEPDGKFNDRPDLIERLIEANAWVNPTLHVMQAAINNWEARRQTEGLTKTEEADLDGQKRELDTRVKSVANMIGQGVKMVAGSDSPWGYYAPGEFIHEMEMLERAGLSSSDAMLAGTSWSAASIGVSDSSGALATGRRADVLVAGGDPLGGVKALWDVRDVYQAGERVERGVQ
ncbi:MAG: amidohydrolase family protein [Chloroflexi bacterium]|nr:amidohydrolase family protein [Chloroflexota bacterium]